MNVTDYTYLMNKPDAISEKQADALGSVLNEFPYFQSARALRLKGLYSQNSFKYNYALKVTAAHTSDRSVLFDFITSEDFTAIQSEFYDRKLRDLLEIKVVDSEVISFSEIKKTTETRIDPVEQSILNSIREATNATFEEPAVTIDKPSVPLNEQSILNSFQEVTPESFEETAKIEELKIEPITEELILDSFKEVIPITFEEPEKVEEIIIEPVSEQEILDTFIAVTPTFEEPAKTEEKPNDLIIEQSILNSIIEATNITFVETSKIEEQKIEPIIEEPIITPSKETMPTFFEEIVEDEFPEARVDSIEKSVPDAIEESTTVTFEETITPEEPIEVEIPEAVKIAEENLEIGKPLDFSGNEKHSFHEWLQLARTEPIDRTEGPEEAKKKADPKVEAEIIVDEKKKKAEIINKFIETNPKIPPIKQTAIVPAVQFDLNKEDNSYLMTETLARVYLEQKKYTKAIQAYEILILKYPEKISFFADRISDIKILQQNNNNN
ncbi:tetratricopeptide repeat protein [Flavobacterium sp. FlaQc-47]|uniref:tetratricopeptide repeat protein n=1 Tax=Flavobacterium sp. FlaQc-47 TaxID=3374180 RepID=UPI003757D1F0